jgi:hypothetical protein
LQSTFDPQPKHQPQGRSQGTLLFLEELDSCLALILMQQPFFLLLKQTNNTNYISGLRASNRKKKTFHSE